GGADEQRRGVDARLHVRQLESDGLVLDDRPAELLALLGVVEGVLVGGPGDADGLGADGWACRLERRHGRLAARGLALPRPCQARVELLLATQQPAAGDAAVLEDDLGRVRGEDAGLLEVLARPDTQRAGGHDAGRGCARAAIRA